MKAQIEDIPRNSSYKRETGRRYKKDCVVVEGKPDRGAERECGDGDPADKVKFTRRIIEVMEGKIGRATKVERSQANAWSTGGSGTSNG